MNSEMFKGLPTLPRHHCASPDGPLYTEAALCEFGKMCVTEGWNAALTKAASYLFAASNAEESTFNMAILLDTEFEALKELP